MELLIIRHGQSENNALTDLTERKPDPSLTDLGKEQADLLAKALAGTNGNQPYAEDSHFDRIYCSPMVRALETARAVGDALGINPEIWIDLHEHGGVFLREDGERAVGYPGVNRDVVNSEFPGFIVPDEITDNGWWTGTVEEDAGWCARATRAARQLKSLATENSRIAIVSHGGQIDTLLKALLNQMPGHGIYYSHANTAVTKVLFGDDGALRIRFMNRVDHLET